MAVLQREESWMERHKLQNIETVKAGLEKALGKETTNLVLKTLRVVYKMDEETIVSNPELFEEKIKKMFGDMTTEIILKAISEARY